MDNNKDMDKYLVPLETPCVYYDADFLSVEEANAAYDELLKSTAWETTSKINRYVALCERDDEDRSDMAAESSSSSRPYKYRDAPPPGAAAAGAATLKRPYTATIQALCTKAEAWYQHHTGGTRVTFNVCLLNFYENGNQRIGWHCDREEIGRTTPIASISLGVARDFQLRAKHGLERTSLLLENGSLVIMENVCQKEYLHCLPKRNHVTEGRINLTFRCKTGEDTPGEQEHDRRDKWLERITDLQQQQGLEEGEGEGNKESYKQVYPNQSLALAMEKDAEDDHDENGGGETSTSGTRTVLRPVFGDIKESQQELHIKLQHMTVLYTVKTNIGAEGYAAAEIQERLMMMMMSDNSNNQQNLLPHHHFSWTVVPRPWGAGGYIAVGITTNHDSPPLPEEENNNKNDLSSLDAVVVEATLLKLRAAYFVMKHHDQFTLADVAMHAGTSEDITQVKGEELYQFYKQRLVDNQATIPTLLLPVQQQDNEKEYVKMRKEEIPEDIWAQYNLDDFVDDQGWVYSKVSKAWLDGLDNNDDTKQQDKQDKDKNKIITFRVTCERIGEKHKFQAPHVEYEIGGAMSEYYTHTKPKMEDYDVNVRVDVIGNQVMVGTQINFVDLTKRHNYRFRNKVTIKASIAYIMLRCANVQPNQTILDPFCGSGTILLEAMEMEPTIQCIGMDVNRRSVEGARENAQAVALGGNTNNNCQFHCIDVRAFRKHVPDQSIDCIVSNLPWGVQTGQKRSVTDLQSMYEIFLRNAWYTLKDHGRVVLLVLRGLQLTRIIRKLGGRYRILRANVVRTSNNLPCIVVIEKLPRDILNETIKGQLAYLSQFVSVSSEMYHAIHHEDIADGVDAPEPASRTK
jgi:tRNA G10  N-methylase Trm11/alkylated DNA repair dioxygenase AlkB